MTTASIAQPQPGRRRHGKSTDVPRIKLISWLGLESIAWGIVFAHLIKWAVSFGYFATVQLDYKIGYGPTTFSPVYWKDSWDRLVVHVQNGIGYWVSVGIGITVAAVLAALLWRYARTWASPWAKTAAIGTYLLAGAGAGLLAASRLSDWRVHWFATQAAPAWWVTTRHDIRDVGIALLGTILVRMLFTKPKYPADDRPGLRVYLTSVPLAIGVALIPISLVAVLAWQVPWLQRHGWEVPARFGVLASETNGWIAAGTWITVAMGILGGLAASFIIQRVADDVQWFVAERSAAKVRSTAGLNALRGERVIGSPSHRRRVHWLLDNQPDLPERNPWLTRGLLVIGLVTLLFAGAGAWLNLAGPAAPH
jgi:hypothetical protein